MTDNRPAPPAAVKRQLRQEAGFGCCFCGHPFLQYHHIVPWAEDAHFRPEDMMVVCGQCHHLLTVGAIPDEDQRGAKENPRNIVDGLIKGRLYVTSKELTVMLGGGSATETPCLLEIKKKSIISVRLSPLNGRVLISAEIQDSSGQAIANLIDNDWSMLPGAVWDFESYPLHATVRTGPGNIAFSVEARNDIVSMQGKWHISGQPLEFTQKSVKWKGRTSQGINGYHNRIHIGID